MKKKTQSMADAYFSNPFVAIAALAVKILSAVCIIWGEPSNRGMVFGGICFGMSAITLLYMQIFYKGD